MKIKIKVHPNSSNEKIKKINEKEFEIWIKDKPIKNKANEKVVKLLRKYFNQDAKLVSGFTSKIKIIELK